MVRQSRRRTPHTRHLVHRMYAGGAVHTLDPDLLGVFDGHEKVLLGLVVLANGCGMNGGLVRP